MPFPESTFAARFDKKVVGFQNLPERILLKDVMKRHRNWRSIFVAALDHEPKIDDTYVAMVAVSPDAPGLGGPGSFVAAQKG